MKNHHLPASQGTARWVGKVGLLVECVHGIQLMAKEQPFVWVGTEKKQASMGGLEHQGCG